MFTKEKSEQQKLLIHLSQLLANSVVDERTLKDTFIIPNLYDEGFAIRSKALIPTEYVWDITFPDCPDSPSPISFTRYDMSSGNRVHAATCEIGGNQGDELIVTISIALAQALAERNRTYAEQLFPT